MCYIKVLIHFDIGDLKEDSQKFTLHNEKHKRNYFIVFIKDFTGVVMHTEDYSKSDWYKEKDERHWVITFFIMEAAVKTVSLASLNWTRPWQAVNWMTHVTTYLLLEVNVREKIDLTTIIPCHVNLLWIQFFLFFFFQLISPWMFPCCLIEPYHSCTVLLMWELCLNSGVSFYYPLNIKSSTSTFSLNICRLPYCSHILSIFPPVSVIITCLFLLHLTLPLRCTTQQS